MLKNRLTFLSALAFLYLVLCPAVLAEPIRVTSLDLMNDTLKYDGKEVVYLGEVIGQVMNRGPYSWANIYDGEYGLGVYASAEMLNYTLIWGDYDSKGDIVEVTGVFHRACAEHGADADIHAKNVRIIKGGYAVEHPISMSKVFFTMLLLVSNIPLLILIRRMKDEPQ